MSTLLAPKPAPRFNASMLVVFSNGGASYIAETKNVSNTGLCIRSKQALPVGTQLHIVFGMPPELPRLSTEGIVRWSQSGEAVGVEFTYISPHDHQALLEYVISQRREEQV
jgi:c-di-GMP-binding flagellar brake protein YcgR